MFELAATAWLLLLVLTTALFLAGATVQALSRWPRALLTAAPWTPHRLPTPSPSVLRSPVTSQVRAA